MSYFDELLLDPKVQANMTDTKAYKEVQKLEEFMETMRDEPNKAVYGLSETR